VIDESEYLTDEQLDEHGAFQQPITLESVVPDDLRQTRKDQNERDKLGESAARLQLRGDFG
jgi:hypothetical protein